MRSNRELEYIEVNDDFFWSAQCRGFAIGDLSNSWRWGPIQDAGDFVKRGEVYTIFDTTNRAITIPLDYYSDFISELYSTMREAEYEIARSYVLTKCYEDLPSLFFLIGDMWVTVDPSDYVLDVSDFQDRSICVLALQPGEGPFFVMGAPLFADYYTVFDDTKGRIGFVPRINSSINALSPGR